MFGLSLALSRLPAKPKALHPPLSFKTPGTAHSPKSQVPSCTRGKVGKGGEKRGGGRGGEVGGEGKGGGRGERGGTGEVCAGLHGWKRTAFIFEARARAGYCRSRRARLREL